MAGFTQASQMLRVATRDKGFTDITPEVGGWLASIGAEEGVVTVFVCHTSASLTIQENANSNVPFRGGVEELGAEGRDPRPSTKKELRHAQAAASSRCSRT